MAIKPHRNMNVQTLLFFPNAPFNAIWQVENICVIHAGLQMAKKMHLPLLCCVLFIFYTQNLLLDISNGYGRIRMLPKNDRRQLASVKKSRRIPTPSPEAVHLMRMVSRRLFLARRGAEGWSSREVTVSSRGILSLEAFGVIEYSAAIMAGAQSESPWRLL